MRPMTRVTAKPFTGPVPNMNKKAQDTTVVTCVSMMVRNALPKPALDGRGHSLSGSEFLSNSFKNKDIAVNCHADAQNHPGNPRQRQHSSEIAERGHRHHAVQDQRQRRIDPALPVVHQHEGDHGGQPHQTGDQSLADRVGAQRGTDGAFLDVKDARRERTRPQHQRQIGGVLLTVGARDPAGVIDPGLDRGHAPNLVIQHHGQPVSDVGLREPSKAPGPVLRQREVGVPSLKLVPSGPGVAQIASP